jgi:hypothetical protein
VFKLDPADEKRINEIDKQLDEIAQKFDDGELTAKEMREQSKVLTVELDDLKDKRTLAKMSGKQTVDTWQQVTVPAFLAVHTEYKEGSLRYKLLDEVVRDIQKDSEDPTDPMILAKAHEKIVAELGEVHGSKKPAVKTNGSARCRPTSTTSPRPTRQRRSIPTSSRGSRSCRARPSRRRSPSCRRPTANSISSTGERCSPRPCALARPSRSGIVQRYASSTSRDQWSNLRFSPICRCGCSPTV